MIAHQRANDNFDRHIQIGCHPLNGQHLLIIFATKIRPIGGNNLKQFHHHRRHATEVARPRGPFPRPRHAFHINMRGKTCRIHFFEAWSEHQIDAGAVPVAPNHFPACADIRNNRPAD